MTDTLTLRYADMAVTVPTADVQMALKKFLDAPGMRSAQVEQTKEWLARSYPAVKSGRTNKQAQVYFGMGVAILYANEIIEGRAEAEPLS